MVEEAFPEGLTNSIISVSRKSCADVLGAFPDMVIELESPRLNAEIIELATV